MADKEHPLERRARLLAEALDRKIQRLVEYFKTPEGRPAFQIMLSKQEELERFMNPTMRAEAEARLYKQGGPEAVEKYTNRMRDAMLEEQ